MGKLFQVESRRVCSNCSQLHKKATPVRRLHRPRARHRNYSQIHGESTSLKITLKRKLVYGLSFGAAGLGVYYVSLDEANKRKIRVVIGGVGRFFRCVHFNN